MDRVVIVFVVADVHKKMTSNVSIDIIVCPLVHFLAAYAM